MFKKKANNKKVDLNQELQQISLAPQPQQNQIQDSYVQSAKQQESAPIPKLISRQKLKANFISLQALQKVQITENKPLEREYEQLKKEEMTDYLKQIRNFKPIETTEEEIEQSNLLKNNVIVIEQNNGYNSEDYDENEMIEVQQDLQGGFTPQREQDNEFQEDYEDQLIKRTLTKHNYEKLRLRGGPNLSDLKALQTKDKLLEKIEKVSSKKIQSRIKRDLQHKRQKLSQIEQELRMKKYSSERQKNEISKKQKRLEDLKKQLEKVNSIIQYMYYYGDKVTMFEKDAILKQIQNQGKPQMIYNYDDVE